MSLAIKWRGLAWYRKVLMVVFAIGLMGSLSSLLAQYVMGLNPCVMCIQQRVAMMVMTLMAGISLLLPVAKSWARGLAVMLASVYSKFTDNRTALLWCAVDVQAAWCAFV